MKFIWPIIFLIAFILYLTINKSTNIYIEGEIFDCNLKAIQDKTIFIGIFKDIKSIKEKKPLKHVFIENINTYKINLSDLEINNFFLLAYTVDKKIISIPYKESLINEWDTSLKKEAKTLNLKLCKKEEKEISTIFFNFEDEKVDILEDININKVLKNNLLNMHINDSNNYYLYKINGSIDEENLNEICKKQNNNLKIFIEIYNTPLELFYPINSNYSIKTIAPIDAVILDCNETNFELRFKSSVEKVYPYIVARAVDLYTKKTLYYAIANNINGIPLDLLSKRKDNAPFTLKLEKNIFADFGTLKIQTKKAGLIAEIVNLPDINVLEKAYLSDLDGLITINKLPLNSLFCINIIDPKTLNIINFEIFFQYPNQFIKIPNLSSLKSSLTLIHNYNFKNIHSLSTDPKNKFNLDFDNYLHVIKNLNFETIFLNLVDFNNNTYSLNLNIDHNLIVQLDIVNLFEISGRINYFDKTNLNIPCFPCSIKLENQEFKTFENSNYLINLSKPLLNNALYLNIEDKYFINSLLINSQHSLELDINLPNKHYINYLNSISPSRPNNSLIFSNLVSDRVILSINKKIIEAKYIDNKYFFIPDLEPNIYTIFYLENNKITHIRNINIKDKGVYILL